MKLTNRKLIYILLMAAILGVFTRQFWVGRTLLLQSAAQLKTMDAEIYAFSLVMLSTIRELSPVVTAITFCLFLPFIFILCAKEDSKNLYKKFFLIVFLFVICSNIIGIFASLLGANVAASRISLFPSALTVAMDAVVFQDILVSFIKSVGFAIVLCLLTYFLSKSFLKREELKYKLIFVVGCIFLGNILIVASDILITYIAWKFYPSS